MTTTRSERLAALRAPKQRLRLTKRQFEMVVAQAMSELPVVFRQRIENVAVLVEDWPSGASAPSDRDGSQVLFGLYQGTPLGERGSGYHLATPDRITIFRGPILAACRTRAEVEHEIRQTVLHEVGHFFGLPDQDLP